MRKVSSAPNLKGGSPIGTPMIKSVSNSALSALPISVDPQIEVASHATINSLAKCVISYGFPDEIIQSKDSERAKDLIACIMTPDEDEKREITCPVEDKRFERVASIVRRQKKKK